MIRFALSLTLTLTLAVAAATTAGVRAQSAAVPPTQSSAPPQRQSVPDYEGRQITAIDVVTEGVPRRDAALEAEIRQLLPLQTNSTYALARVRESIAVLFESGRIANARVEALPVGADGVRLIYYARPQARVADVLLRIAGPGVAAPTERQRAAAPTASVITEDELRSRLNLLEPGTRVTEQSLRTAADAIQVYLRDRGYYRADVRSEQQLDATGTRSTITFFVDTGEQARVEDFRIDVKNFDASQIADRLALRRGVPFSRSALGDDVNRLREAIIKGNRLAPQLGTPQVTLNSDANTVSIELSGSIGPAAEVVINGYDLSDRQKRELLPVLREGSVDYSAIEEGVRRLRNKVQQEGYFFADVQATCGVAPPFAPATPTTIDPAVAAGAVPAPPPPASASCADISVDELTDRTLTITYNVEPGRRFKLNDIRIEGTDKISLEEIEDDLRTQRATLLGFIPLLGYGRGYTSPDLLDRDRATIQSRLAELGYRQAAVEVRQGVSLDGENLIITFVVEEGPLTRLTDVQIRGNQLYTAERLRDARCRNALLAPSDPQAAEADGCLIVDGPFSREVARRDGERLRVFYADEGYIGTTVSFDIVELPPTASGDQRVRLIYTVREGNKIFLNRIVVSGNVRTSREAIINSLPLREGQTLRAGSLRESERILFATGAFRQVTIRPERLQGETRDGYRRSDIIIELEELPPRDLTYGFGFSNIDGPLGLIELRDNNLFGSLQQGAARVRLSQRRQLGRIDFFNPRFRSVGEDKRNFWPLRFSTQYQRDTNVTRFFRSTIDRGNFGIVQRLDAEGNPIDQFGEPAGEPSINRFTTTVETQRLLDEGARSTLFLRYSYEDVRLFKTDSLLIADILRPDRVVRLSTLGASFARDTRDQQTDATRGQYLSVDYALSLRALGGNISFSKFQSTYRRYYQLGFLRNVVLAGGASVGLANIMNARDRDGNGQVDDIDRALPISERFFAGGSNSLRGFGYQEAGPRAFVPGGLFFNDEGEQVRLVPYTVPIGGNALAVLNGEARIPVTKDLQVVPFYDGGNVFDRVGDIFKAGLRPGENPNRHVRWTHTVGLGLRFKTPFGPLGVDYGFLLNTPEFALLPGQIGFPGTSRPKRAQFHFRFGQAY